MEFSNQQMEMSIEHLRDDDASPGGKMAGQLLRNLTESTISSYYRGCCRCQSPSGSIGTLPFGVLSSEIELAVRVLEDFGFTAPYY
jgi:hypothetical protein